MIFSPHPDDDVISMGGTIERLVNQGHEVYIAYQVSGNIAVFNEDMHIEVNHELLYIDDANSENEGPSNGLANAGEVVDIYLYLENLSSNSITSLDGYISTNSQKIDIIDGNIEIDNLVPSTPTISGPIQVFIHEDLISTDNTDLTLTLMDESDGPSDWNFNIPFNVLSANIEIHDFYFNQSPNPGNTVGLEFEFRNNGTDGLNNCSLGVSIDNSLLDITNSESFIGDMQPGGTLQSVGPIIIELSEDIIDGSIFNLNINIFNEDGFSQDHIINFSVGVADEHDPLGPDSYGYYIYDWTDVGYNLTPFYEWIEIDPTQGGDGTDLGISDSGNGNGISNSTKYIDLPFTFTFYGQDYDEISVNANGWISFGHSNMESFRNYQLPGAGGPSPMLAAFWDDLKTNSSSKVLKYVTDSYVIIEWSEMRTYQNNSVDLYDGRQHTVLYETYRGCPFKCTFCNSAKTILRGRSVAKMIELILMLRYTYGIRQIYFYDDTFTANPKLVKEFCNEMIKRAVDVRWICYVRGDMFKEPIAELMSKAGCHQVFIGIESGSETIMNSIGKPIKRERYKRVVDIAHKNKIEVRASFIIGHPDETEETMEQTLSFAKYLGVDFFQVNILTPYPGTILYKQLKEQGSIIHERYERYGQNELVFNMKYFEELKYREMSEILDTSEGALKASYHIAAKKIEEYLKSN